MNDNPISAVAEDMKKAPPGFDQKLISAATVVASILRHADQSPTPADLLDKATTIARRALGRDALALGCRYDEGAAEAPVDVIRLLAELVASYGFVRLSRVTLECLRGVVSDSYDVRRIELGIARQWRAEGFVDLAEAQFRKIRSSATRARQRDIAAHANSGLGSCAQTRGNLAEMRKFNQQSAILASRSGLRRLASTVYAGIGVADAMSKDYSSAIINLWKGYRFGGRHPALKQEALGNLSQVLLLAGEARAAQRLSSSLLRQRLPVRMAMPVLGSYVVAAAHIGNRSDVLWAARQAERLCESGAYPRESATLLIETGLALSAVGEANRGDGLTARGGIL